MSDICIKDFPDKRGARRKRVYKMNLCDYNEQKKEKCRARRNGKIRTGQFGILRRFGHVKCIDDADWDKHCITRRALGGAHVPPTKVF